MMNNADFVIIQLLTPRTLSGVLAFLVLALVSVTVVMIYHWRQYGRRTRPVKIVSIVYIAGHAALIIIAGMALLKYSAVV